MPIDDSIDALLDEIAVLSEHGELPPDLYARVARTVRDRDPALAERTRSTLLAAAASDDELARATLQLLSDDPWWFHDDDR